MICYQEKICKYTKIVCFLKVYVTENISLQEKKQYHGGFIKNDGNIAVTTNCSEVCYRAVIKKLR